MYPVRKILYCLLHKQKNCQGHDDAGSIFIPLRDQQQQNQQHKHISAVHSRQQLFQNRRVNSHGIPRCSRRVLRLLFSRSRRGRLFRVRLRRLLRKGFVRMFFRLLLWGRFRFTELGRRWTRPGIRNPFSLILSVFCRHISMIQISALPCRGNRRTVPKRLLPDGRFGRFAGHGQSFPADPEQDRASARKEAPPVCWRWLRSCWFLCSL